MKGAEKGRGGPLAKARQTPQVDESKTPGYDARMKASEAIDQVAVAFNIPDERRGDLVTVIEEFAAGMMVVSVAVPGNTIPYERRDDLRKVIADFAAGKLGVTAHAQAPEAATPRLEHAAKETTTRKRGPRIKATPRPHWKTARIGDETLPQFIKREFAAELADGTMTRAMLNRYDKLSSDFYGYPRHHEMPEWLKAIPTQDEWKKRQIAEGNASPVEAPLPPPRTDEVRAYDRGRKRVAAARRQGIPVLDHP
jgi:hypothetical protein